MTFKLFGGETVECRACHEEVSTDATECPHCGEDLTSFKLFGGDLVECRACGREISNDADECPHCGEDLESFKLFGGDLIECRTCGRKISTDAAECPHCGEDLEGFKLLGGDLIECRACDRMISTDATECPYCGEDLEGFKLLGGDLVECRACNRMISTDADVCPYCGEELDNSFFSSPLAPTASPVKNHGTPTNNYESSYEPTYETGQHSPSSDGNTGNNSHVWLWLIIIVIICMALSVFFANKSNMSQSNTQYRQPVQTSQQGYSSRPVVQPTDTLAAYYANMEAVDPYDTSSIKRNLLGNTIPGVRFSDTTEFAQFDVINRAVYSERIECTVNIFFTYSAEAQVVITYFKNNDHWSLLGVIENEIVVDQIIPDTGWVQACLIPNIKWQADNQHHLSWKVDLNGAEYYSGPDLPELSLPIAGCYWLQSRDNQPVSVRFSYHPTL